MEGHPQPPHVGRQPCSDGPRIMDLELGEWSWENGAGAGAGAAPGSSTRSQPSRLADTVNRQASVGLSPSHILVTLSKQVQKLARVKPQIAEPLMFSRTT